MVQGIVQETGDSKMSSLHVELEREVGRGYCCIADIRHFLEHFAFIYLLIQNIIVITI